MDLEAYKRRLKATSTSEAVMDATARQLKQVFKNSPFYKVVLVDGIQKGARVNNDDNKSNIQHILLESNETVKKGSVVEIESKFWMSTECYKSQLYPRMVVQRCNSSLKWKDDLGNLYDYPCVVDSKEAFDLDESKVALNPSGNLKVLVPYNYETNSIVEKQRFVINDNAYEVVGIDNISQIVDGEGYLILTIERTMMSDEDDTTNSVADNNTTGSGWGGGW